MSKTYDLRLRGKTYSGISLTEVKQIMSEVYTYAYIQGMVDKANVDTSPVEIEWIPGKNMNWIVDNVRMGRKCGLFALEFRGHTRDEAEWLLHANKLCADVEETTKMIREACKQIDEEWKTWLSERRRIYAKSPAV